MEYFKQIWIPSFRLLLSQKTKSIMKVFCEHLEVFQVESNLAAYFPHTSSDNFISFPSKSIPIQTQLYSPLPPEDDNKFPPKAVPVKSTAWARLTEIYFKILKTSNMSTFNMNLNICCLQGKHHKCCTYWWE